MATGYLLQDNPNKSFAQFGWPRKKVSGAIGVHTAENNTDFAGPDPGAEDVARYIGRRTDPGSYHAIADADSRIKLIHPRYSAWADTTNNAHGMSVSAAMQAARWRELTPERAAAITRNLAYAAAELVQDALAAGLLTEAPPARRITPAEAVAGTRAGFYGHGETNPGRRYDPGQHFDWGLFLRTYASAIGGVAAMGTTSSSTESQEDDVVSAEDRAAIAKDTAEMIFGWVLKEKDDAGAETGHTANLSWYLLSRAAAVKDERENIADAVWGKHFIGADGKLIIPRWILESFHGILADQRRMTAEAAAALVAEATGLDPDVAYKAIAEGVGRVLDGVTATVTLGAQDGK